MGLPRVVYLSSGPLAERMLGWLSTQPCSITYANMRSELMQPGWDYDLGLNFLGTTRIPADEVKRRPWVNFHPAPLPEYGGRNVAYQAILDGAEQFGATIHYMDEGFDTGPIIECRRFPISGADTAGDIFEKAVAHLVNLFKQWVPDLLRGTVPSIPQTETRYFRKTPINDVVFITEEQKKTIRALTCAPNHFAKISIAGRLYRIVPED